MSQKLVDEFRSKLDEALILAIASEYNFENNTSFEEARGVLQSLAQDADAEEATGFDPNGLSTSLAGLTVPDDQTKSSSNGLLSSVHESGTQQSETQTSQMSSLSSPGDDYDESDVPRITSFDQATAEDKIAQLRNMFPATAEEKVKQCLERSDGDFQSALEELLTLQCLASLEPESATPRPAADDFFKPDAEPRRRRKGKKKRGEANGAQENGQFKPNCTEEILYISNRLNLDYDDVAGPYFRNTCSQGKTIVVVLDSFIAQGVEAQDDAGKALARELGNKHKRVPPQYLLALVQLVSLPEFADDIARVLDGHFSKPAKEHLAINYTLAPPEHLVTDGFTVVATKNGAMRPTTASSPAGLHVSSPRNAAWADAARTAALYRDARSTAAESASQAARKGRSNPLFRQVAGVYADIARENDIKAHRAASVAADLLVAQHRSSNTIDLHGVSVADGVRIALTEVRAWYSSLGEYKAKRAREEGFTVVTGLGRHSVAGVSRLRKAVCVALVEDGWKVEVGTGRFTVTGRH